MNRRINDIKYRNGHRTELREKSKDYRRIYSKEISIQRHEYYLKNKEIILKKIKNYISNRIKTDVKFRLLRNLRLRIWESLKGKIKSESTIKLIGCSIKNLKVHLEKKFTPGMNWSNYGKWHIDHIKPCASFDLSNLEEQHKCFHYTNLQPMWASDNLKKGSKQ